MCLYPSWDTLIPIRDSPALIPVISQVHTWDFVASRGASPRCLPQNFMYVPAILLELELGNPLYISGYPNLAKDIIRFHFNNLKPYLKYFFIHSFRFRERVTLAKSPNGYSMFAFLMRGEFPFLSTCYFWKKIFATQ